MAQQNHIRHMLCLHPWQMLRVREVMMSLLELQDGGFRMLKLVVEKGIQQVICMKAWVFLHDWTRLDSVLLFEH